MTDARATAYRPAAVYLRCPDSPSLGEVPDGMPCPSTTRSILSLHYSSTPASDPGFVPGVGANRRRGP
jgi:hypothetical protein